MAKKQNSEPRWLTTITLQVSKDQWRLSYSGKVDNPTEKKEIRHDLRVISALASDERLCAFFYRLVKPALNYYRRQARQKKTPSISPASNADQRPMTND